MLDYSYMMSNHRKDILFQYYAYLTPRHDVLQNICFVDLFRSEGVVGHDEHHVFVELSQATYEHLQLLVAHEGLSGDCHMVADGFERVCVGEGEEGGYREEEGKVR